MVLSLVGAKTRGLETLGSIAGALVTGDVRIVVAEVWFASCCAGGGSCTCIGLMRSDSLVASEPIASADICGDGLAELSVLIDCMPIIDCKRLHRLRMA